MENSERLGRQAQLGFEPGTGFELNTASLLVRHVEKRMVSWLKYTI